MATNILDDRKELILLLIIIFGALFHGLIYVFLVSPWQHYDEPNHFEYVWLIANRPGMPQIGDYDQVMRRRVAASMIENGFLRGMDFMPDLEIPDDKPIWIGQYSQLQEPPLYYLIVSFHLNFINSEDIDLGSILAWLVYFL